MEWVVLLWCDGGGRLQPLKASRVLSSCGLAWCWVMLLDCSLEMLSSSCFGELGWAVLGRNREEACESSCCALFVWVWAGLAWGAGQWLLQPVKASGFASPSIYMLPQHTHAVPAAD